jgi:hypothetical protein
LVYFIGPAAIANAIKDMRALSKLIFNGGVHNEYTGWEEGDTVDLESAMIEANFSNKKLGEPGAIIISAWLASGKDNGAMTSLSLASNHLGVEGAKLIAVCLLKCMYVALYPISPPDAS